MYHYAQNKKVYLTTTMCSKHKNVSVESAKKILITSKYTNDKLTTQNTK